MIDPLDGTTNFIHGFPQYCVSIALKYKGKLEHAVIYDPNRDEEFTASRGRGAALNGRRIRCTNRPGLEGCLIGTGFPFRKDQAPHMDAYLGMFADIAASTAGLRRPGSAALDLAWLAAGRLDGFFEFGLSEWDLAAGALLITEAGGLVGDLSGGHKFLESGGIVAGSPPADHMARNGLLGSAKPYNLVVDRRYESPVLQLLDDVKSGETDAAILWGPLAGPLVKTDYPELQVTPLVKETLPPRLFFRITMGVRMGEKVWERELNSLIRRHQDEINEVLVEAGAGLSGAFWRAGLVDELIVYMAPRLLGSQARPLMQLPFESMSEAMDVAVTDMRAIGQDWRITARPIFPS